MHRLVAPKPPVARPCSSNNMCILYKIQNLAAVPPFQSKLPWLGKNVSKEKPNISIFCTLNLKISNNFSKSNNQSFNTIFNFLRQVPLRCMHHFWKKMLTILRQHKNMLILRLSAVTQAVNLVPKAINVVQIFISKCCRIFFFNSVSS